jgi:hypothetical protein
MAVYRQSVHLGVKPLETHDQSFYPAEPLRLWSLYNIISEKKMGFSLMNMLSLSPSVRIAHITTDWALNLISLITSRHGRVEDTAFVAVPLFVFIAVGARLPSHWTERVLVHVFVSTSLHSRRYTNTSPHKNFLTVQRSSFVSYGKL